MPSKSVLPPPGVFALVSFVTCASLWFDSSLFPGLLHAATRCLSARLAQSSSFPQLTMCDTSIWSSPSMSAASEGRSSHSSGDSRALSLLCDSGHSFSSSAMWHSPGTLRAWLLRSYVYSSFYCFAFSAAAFAAVLLVRFSARSKHSLSYPSAANVGTKLAFVQNKAFPSIRHRASVHSEPKCEVSSSD